jgi:acyl-CoA thioester hydrolase
MEEARVDFLDQIGYGYAKLEEDGIISPVLTVECEYKKPLRFGDSFEVLPEIL